MSTIIATTEMIQNYLLWDPNDETRAQVQVMVDEGAQDKLNQILTTRLAFGTAGLRAPMGPGYNVINDLVVLQTIQGLIRYLDTTFGAEAKAMVTLFSLFNYLSLHRVLSLVMITDSLDHYHLYLLQE